MPKEIKAYQCNFCSRYRINKASISRHEKICFSNPDRKILEGQLAIWKTLPDELKQWDSYGVEGSDFMEPMWNPNKVLSQKYKWWPRDKHGEIDLGYVYRNGVWKKIEGYEMPHFAPGFSWKNEVIPENY